LLRWQLERSHLETLNHQRLSRAFTVEAAKREIYACEDVDRLRDVALNLMLQVEALRDMTAELLLRRG